MRHFRSATIVVLLLLVGSALGHGAPKTLEVIGAGTRVRVLEKQPGENEEQFRKRADQERLREELDLKQQSINLLRKEVDLLKKTQIYKTQTGRKVYHRDGCMHLRWSKIPISPMQAKLDGRRPGLCCNPPSVPELRGYEGEIEQIEKQLQELEKLERLSPSSPSDRRSRLG